MIVLQNERYESANLFYSFYAWEVLKHDYCFYMIRSVGCLSIKSIEYLVMQA